MHRCLLPLVGLLAACAPRGGDPGSPDVTFEHLESAPPAADLVVNEFMAANGGSLRLDDQSSPDWIELHNADAEAIDLGGYYLSDDPDDPASARLPDSLVIEAGGFLLLYASGDSTLGPQHLDLGLSSEGEDLLLTDRWGRRLDWVQFGAQSQDVSVARSTDGDRDADWRYALVGTPGSTNNP